VIVSTLRYSASTMALPYGNFFVQDKLGTTAPHHESFQQLWETKWKAPVCSTRDVTGDAALTQDTVHHGRLPFHVRFSKGL